MTSSSTNQTALYRKYRPDSFAAIKNQEHIISVLEGAIAKNAIPHAVLFCGGRGTGKTTTARIFAHAVGASDVDIYEIDAASNRGVDDIRELREAVHTLPYESERKVYIIDEVHMLTKEAFNALLKTLEEPPAHVVFILATTEQDKLLPTITSRCQVFTFRNPDRATLRSIVIEVAQKEGFTLENDAADLIAIAADGSFRDALGVTQKVITASKDATANADEVAAIIGAPKSRILQDLVEALHTNNTTEALGCLQQAVEMHVDLTLFLKLLLERLRLVMLLRNKVSFAENILSHYTTEEQTVLTTLVATPGALNSHVLGRLLAAAEQLRYATIPQLVIELAIIDVTEKKV